MVDQKMTKSQEFFLILRELNRFPFRWKHAFMIAREVFKPSTKHGRMNNFKMTFGSLMRRLLKCGLIGKLERGIYHVTLTGRRMPLELVKPWAVKNYPWQ